jgi:hypothetical protein
MQRPRLSPRLSSLTRPHSAPHGPVGDSPRDACSGGMSILPRLPIPAIAPIAPTICRAAFHSQSPFDCSAHRRAAAPPFAAPFPPYTAPLGPTRTQRGQSPRRVFRMNVDSSAFVDSSNCTDRIDDPPSCIPQPKPLRLLRSSSCSGPAFRRDFPALHGPNRPHTAPSGTVPATRVPDECRFFRVCRFQQSHRSRRRSAEQHSTAKAPATAPLIVVQRPRLSPRLSSLTRPQSAPHGPVGDSPRDACSG